MIIYKETMMILTNKQAHLLLLILQDTLTKNIVGYLSLSNKERLILLNEIINQQDNKLIDLTEV